MTLATSICVVGAGSVGCYIGGRLAARGHGVVFIGRQSMADALAQHGLQLSDLHSQHWRVAASAIRFSTDLSAAADADLILVTTKSAATADIARGLAAIAKPGAVLLSLQNGLRNAQTLAAAMPQHIVLSGMVPYNIAHAGNGRFHQGSSGELAVSAHAALAPWRALFADAGMPLRPRPDMRAVLWAKLLMNLNNPINALSGLPLKAELQQRNYRRCLAMAQREALALLALDGIQPARLTPLPATWLPGALSAPDWLFRALGNRMLAIDPLARSSMWDDLERGRPTEVDWINGEVTTLAERHHRPAPVNAKLIDLIRAAESGGKRDWSGAELLTALSTASAATPATSKP